MLSDKMWKALNEQVKWELESAYLYLGMAAWLNEKSMPGFAHWMRKQFEEEVGHAMKLYKYIEERGNRVELLPIAAPQKDWASVKDVIEKSLAHEKKVTGLINALADLATGEKDHATYGVLQWFIKEQVEEEESFQAVLDKLAFIKDSSSGILFIDSEMSKR